MFSILIVKRFPPQISENQVMCSFSVSISGVLGKHTRVVLKYE